MNADEHPALSADDDGLPSLTLVLPEHLEHDLTLQGMVAAVGKVRTGLAFRVQLFPGSCRTTVRPGVMSCAGRYAVARYWLGYMPRP